MVNYSLRVIPKPNENESGTVLILEQLGEYPVFKGDGTDNYLCGTCKNIIAKNVNRGQIKKFILVCPNCGSYNKISGF